MDQPPLDLEPELIPNWPPLHEMPHLTQSIRKGTHGAYIQRFVGTTAWECSPEEAAGRVERWLGENGYLG